MSALNGPVVFLAPEQHAYLVLGAGTGPGGTVIGWERDYGRAVELADVHGAVVVAVPIVRDSTRRRPASPADPTEPPATIAVPAAAVLPTRERAEPPPTIEGPSGRPLGRSARGEQLGADAGWSAARDDVVGNVERVAPFGDPAAPPIPQNMEAALNAAFNGDAEALHAFRRPADNSPTTLNRIVSSLASEEA